MWLEEHMKTHGISHTLAPRYAPLIWSIQSPREIQWPREKSFSEDVRCLMVLPHQTAWSILTIDLRSEI